MCTYTSTLQSPVAATAGDEWGGVPLSHYNISRLIRGTSLCLNPVKRQTANKRAIQKGVVTAAAIVVASVTVVSLCVRRRPERAC